MSKIRVTLTTIAVCLTAAVISAAPITKKQPETTRIPSTTTRTATGSDDALIPASNQKSSDDNADVTVDVEVIDPIDPHEFEVSAPVSGSAQSAGGQAINMNWYSINNGGAIEVSAGNIKMGISIGQNAVGEVAAGNIKMGLGFWYGAGASTPTCACDCAADPVCDGLTDIFDVTAIVNVAFRNGDPVPDSNLACPWVSTDVNCDNLTDIFDVTRMVNVAFRNGDPAVEFCDPCASPAL